MAKPHEGSMKRTEYVEKEPDIGKTAASSPREKMVDITITATIMKASMSDPGPPVASVIPDPTKRPVPMLPPIAIS